MKSTNLRFREALWALRRLADAAEALNGTDPEHFPESYAEDEAEFSRALAAARQILEEENGA